MRVAINLLTEDPHNPSGAHWFWTRVIPASPAPRHTPADSVAAFAAWLKDMDGLDRVLAEANSRMRALGVVRKAGT